MWAPNGFCHERAVVSPKGVVLASRDPVPVLHNRSKIQLDAHVVRIAEEYLRHAGTFDHPAGELNVVPGQKRAHLVHTAFGREGEMVDCAGLPAGNGLVKTMCTIG